MHLRKSIEGIEPHQDFVNNFTGHWWSSWSFDPTQSTFWTFCAISKSVYAHCVRAFSE